MTNWTTLTTPNNKLTREAFWTVVGAYGIVWLTAWSLFRPAIFPSPFDVVAAVPMLWTDAGVGQALATSLWTNVEALALSAGIALPLAYLSRVPLVRPLALGLSELRFLSPAVYFVQLLFLTSGGHELKVAMLVAGESFFILTSMVAIVAKIPSEKFDDARTLRMTEWEVTWWVVVRGTLDQALLILQQNAAMGWCYVMMIEGIVRSEGGVGVMMLESSKYRDFAPLYAIAGIVLAFGIVQDWAIGAFRQASCPYADLVTR